MSRHDDIPPPPPRDLLTFTPVAQTRQISGGWSAEVQRAFVAALARCAQVALAARSVGMTPRSAYQLRRRAGEDSGFARAWDRAIEHGATAARERALERLSTPEPKPIMYRGKVVGWRRPNDDRLLMAALRVLWAERRGMCRCIASGSRARIPIAGNARRRRRGWGRWSGPIRSRTLLPKGRAGRGGGGHDRARGYAILARFAGKVGTQAAAWASEG